MTRERETTALCIMTHLYKTRTRVRAVEDRDTRKEGDGWMEGHKPHYCAAEKKNVHGHPGDDHCWWTLYQHTDAEEP